MSRPKISSANGAHVKLDIPAGWFTTISAISRKGYNQLVTCKYDFLGQPLTNFIVNKWGQPNQTMRDITSTSDQLAIVPQEEPMSLDVNFFYSKVGAVRDRKLQDAKYASTKLNILGNSKPLDAPEEFPDYATFLIFVEDAPDTEQVVGQAGYDDALLTVNIINGFSSPVPDTSSRAIAENGRQAIDDFINKYTDPAAPGPTIPAGAIIPPAPYTPTPELAALPVGIIGAGIAGLYTAMILDSLGIKYEIMEASGRTGGRLFTHNFSKFPGKYQYYDVGAMRYPDTTFMKRTFDLARNRLDLGDQMLPYVKNNENAFKYYNGIRVRQNDEDLKAGRDVFGVSEESKGNVPHASAIKGTDVFWTEALGPLRDYFVKLPFPEAFKNLMELDMHSVTSYLALEKKYPYHVIKWFETMESRTGLFDASLTETVLASLVFNDPRSAGQKIKWFCFDGGSEIVSKAMEARILHKPTHYQRAVYMADSDDGRSITVKFDGGRNPRPSMNVVSTRKYSNVISTMPLGCLRMVDLNDCYLSYGQRNAIRALTYTPSVKIGIQFKTAWWEGLEIIGGQSSTDRPVRDVVYPSYGSDASHPKNEKSNVVIAAYNGMQDAQRLGGLMKGRDTPEEKVLLDLVMRDLADVHGMSVEALWEAYEDHFAWDFYRDEFQLGAFCQFNPGQFKYTYPYVTQPASKGQRLHFAGDATSSFHGWVAGALNSAWRAVLGMLLAHPELKGEDVVGKFKEMWGGSEEWDEPVLAKHVYLGRELARAGL